MSENQNVARESTVQGAIPPSSPDVIRKQHFKHEANIKAVSALFFLCGAGFVLWALVHVTRYPSVLVVALVGLGIFLFRVGTGLRALQPWTKTAAGLCMGLALFVFPLGTAIGGYVLYLLFSDEGDYVFSDAYREVVSATPEIRYRMPVVLTLLLCTVLLLLLFLLSSSDLLSR